MNINPKSQHEAQARAILARRANANNNETGTPTAVKKVVKPVTKKTEEPSLPKELLDDKPDGSEYAGKDVKELRALCKAHDPKIKYTKKDKVADLIVKLVA